MALADHELVASAIDLARAFGVDLRVALPVDAAARAAIRMHLRTILESARSRVDDPSVGDTLGVLLDEVRANVRDPAGVARSLAELHAVFSETSFRRTKRAQRARLFAQLIVLFELEPAMGLRMDPEDDAEAHLKAVRRRLRERR